MSDDLEGLDLTDEEIAEKTAKFNQQKEKEKLEEVSFKEFSKPTKPDSKVIVTEEVKQVIKKDPLESRKQELRDNQENEYADPENIYVEIKIPETGKVGENCVIKFSEKVPLAQVVISANMKWLKRDKYDKASKPELICKGFIIEEFKDVKEVKVPWEDMYPNKDGVKNLLKAGEYMVEARGWSKEAYKETTARRLVQVTKDE
jgi:hypothetical protein